MTKQQAPFVLNILHQVTCCDRDDDDDYDVVAF